MIACSLQFTLKNDVSLENKLDAGIEEGCTYVQIWSWCVLCMFRNSSSCVQVWTSYAHAHDQERISRSRDLLMRS